jgi:autotransporter passenger strand-loop-strand repeat protein
LIQAQAFGVTLTNVGNTISGAGMLLVTLVNSGTIAATYADAALTIDNTGNPDTNDGTLWAHGGRLVINAAVTGTGNQLVTSGGRLELNAVLDTAGGTTVDSGGNEFIYSAGVDIGATLDGGNQIVSASGAASGTTVNAGNQYVYDVGFASGTIVNSGGTEYLYRGGLASGTVLNVNGFQVVSGGAAYHTSVNAGGDEFVYLGGATTSTTVNNLGTEAVWSGGAAFATTIVGGYEYIASGGSAFNRTTISGSGTLELADGAVLDGSPITFAGSGGTLQIDGTTMPTCIISGFAVGDTIDLAGIAFNDQGLFAVTGVPNQLFSSAGAYTLFKPNNVLELVENGQAYDLQLDPSQVFSGGFLLSPDAHEGPGYPPGTKPGTKITAFAGPVGDYSTSAPPAGSVPFNPYGAVCYITTDYGFGAGFIIGPHAILTAAHVVMGSKGLTNTVAVYPGYEKDPTNARPIASGALPVYTDPNYVYSDPQSLSMYQHDFAIIDVAQDLSGYGSFQIGAPFTSGTVNLTGYPGFIDSSGKEVGGTGKTTTLPRPAWMQISAASSMNPTPPLLAATVAARSGW